MLLRDTLRARAHARIYAIQFSSAPIGSELMQTLIYESIRTHRLTNSQRYIGHWKPKSLNLSAHAKDEKRFNLEVVDSAK